MFEGAANIRIPGFASGEVSIEFGKKAEKSENWSRTPVVESTAAQRYSTTQIRTLESRPLVSLEISAVGLLETSEKGLI